MSRVEIKLKQRKQKLISTDSIWFIYTFNTKFNRRPFSSFFKHSERCHPVHFVQRISSVSMWGLTVVANSFSFLFHIVCKFFLPFSMRPTDLASGNDRLDFSLSVHRSLYCVASISFNDCNLAYLWH